MQNNCIQFTIKFVCLRLTSCLRLHWRSDSIVIVLQRGTHHASTSEPQYEIKSAKTDRIAVHNSLHKTACCSEVCQ
jgi:hypothetical protein